MQREFFADGVNSIHWTGNLIRIDFATVQPQIKAQDGQPAIESNSRIIMPVDGFLKAFELQQNIIKQLVDAGVITVNNQQETVVTEPPEQKN